MIFSALAVSLSLCVAVEAAEPSPALPYCVVDTGQGRVFSDRGQLLKAPRAGDAFFGQDGQRRIHRPNYTLSSDGMTVYDRNTGLTWQRSPDTNGDGVLDRGDKLTWQQAQARPAALNAAKYGAYSDWRLPTIKELYSLIDFRGIDPSGMPGAETSGLRPFIDSKFFRFAYGQSPERIIDSQYASCTLYVNKGFRGYGKLFGVNFADGRIKGYDLAMPGGFRQKTFFVQCVRGNPKYGINDFRDNGDQTISDRATGLMWSQEDSGKGMNWEAALAWAQAKNRRKHLGYSDWRLPSAKELQSIVDYARSPDTTPSAAIDPLFTCTRIANEAGQADYACYWTSTTHGESAGRAAIYIAFGRALGYMGGAWRDVHGAGAQRSDPKSGDPAAFPQGRGPQGDAIRILNFVRLVRSLDPAAVQAAEPDLTPIAAPSVAGGRAGLPQGGPEGPLDGPENFRGGGPGGEGLNAPAPPVGYHLLPRFVVERMAFTPEQQQQVSELEKHTKAGLDKILTPEQRKILDTVRPPLPGQGPPNR